MGATYQLAARRKDGSEFPVDVSLSCLATARGQLAYASVRDVTYSRLASIVAGSDDAIVGNDLDGLITSWNGGAERLFGYRESEVVGRHISLLLAPEDVNDLPATLRRIAAGSRVEHHESQRVRKDHSVVDVSVTISPIHGLAGTVIGASTAARNVTERKLAEANMLRQAEELRRSNAELEQFAYVASHDLAEPLRTISGYVELLARRYKGQIDEDADRFIAHTVEGCARMRQLIDDMLEFSRAGRAPQLTDDVEMSTIIDQVVANVTAALDEAGGTVEYGELPGVRADPVQLSQLLQNLVANSVKFAVAGRPTRVRIGAERDDDGRWRISVADNGIGIESEYRDRIFGMFQRLHGREAYPGTGIGLAICLRIVQAHGGRIWVEDNEWGGATVCFTLPASEGEPR